MVEILHKLPEFSPCGVTQEALNSYGIKLRQHVGYVTIQGTSAPRLFSEAGRIVPSAQWVPKPQPLRGRAGVQYKSCVCEQFQQCQPLLVVREQWEPSWEPGSQPGRGQPHKWTYVKRAAGAARRTLVCLVSFIASGFVSLLGRFVSTQSSRKNSP